MAGHQLGATLKISVVLRVTHPAEPVMVIGNTPKEELVLVGMVNVEEPSVVLLGERLTEGNPEALKATDPAKPWTRLIETTAEVDSPCTTANEAGLTDNEKSPTTFSPTLVPCLTLPFWPNTLMLSLPKQTLGSEATVIVPVLASVK